MSLRKASNQTPLKSRRVIGSTIRFARTFRLVSTNPIPRNESRNATLIAGVGVIPDFIHYLRL